MPFGVLPNELSGLNMTINSSKTCCMRIGPRCKVKCVNIVYRSWYVDLLHGLLKLNLGNIFPPLINQMTTTTCDWEKRHAA